MIKSVILLTVFIRCSDTILFILFIYLIFSFILGKLSYFFLILPIELEANCKFSKIVWFKFIMKFEILISLNF